MQPADIMKNDLINPIRLEFQTNQLSFNADQADQIFNRTQPRLTTIEADKHTPREQYWTWFADESKPRIVIFVILLIEISLNFEDKFLKSEFW